VSSYAAPSLKTTAEFNVFLSQALDEAERDPAMLEFLRPQLERISNLVPAKINAAPARSLVTTPHPPKTLALIAAGDALVEAMDMQIKRETGEFHIPQPTAKHLWDEAQTKWKAAVSMGLPDGLYREATNAERSQRIENALQAVDAWREGEDPPSMLAALLADAMHYADAHELDWGTVIHLAAQHHRAEIDEDVDATVDGP